MSKEHTSHLVEDTRGLFTVPGTRVPGIGFLDLIQRDLTHNCVRSWSADERSSRICVCPAHKSSSRVLRRQAGPSIPGSRCAFRPDSIGVSRPRSWHRITAGHDSRGDELQAPSNRVPHRPTAPYPHSARVLGGCTPPHRPPRFACRGPVDPPGTHTFQSHRGKHNWV